jgi:hypothetical protein
MYSINPNANLQGVSFGEEHFAQRYQPQNPICV